MGEGIAALEGGNEHEGRPIVWRQGVTNLFNTVGGRGGGPVETRER